MQAQMEQTTLFINNLNRLAHKYLNVSHSVLSNLCDRSSSHSF